MSAGIPRKRLGRRRRGWLTLLLVVGFGAEGCDGAKHESVGGGTGGNHTGGATADVAGANADTGGTRARGGSGQVVTGGRASGGGGLAGTGAGGQEQIGGGGAGGDAGIDPACHCVLDEFGADCLLSLQDFSARVQRPSSCQNDLDFVTRSTCADGTTQYFWVEGGENDHLLVFDERGNLVYGSVSGYVSGICSSGLPDEGGWTISTGTARPSSTCDTCTVCSNADPGAAGGAGGAGGASTLCP
jgi:hypothetical protein